MPVAEILTLLLVFAATLCSVLVLTPLVMQVGLERSEGQYIKTDGRLSPIYRFTTPERLAQSRWSAALLGGGLAGVILLYANVLNPLALTAACSLAGLLAYQIPLRWLESRIRRRARLFASKMMDLILGLANGLRSGAALPQTLEIVTRDIGGPMQEEFGVLLHEYRLGIDLPNALARLCARMPGEDIFLLATAVSITTQAGGSLAEVLDRMTDTIRSRVDFQEKLNTLTAQGRFEAIAMACAPLAAFVILYFIDGTLMLPLVTTTAGWCAVGVVAIMETIGYFIINQIVTIKV